ncbi:hypothetical protein [Hyphomicrobium sp.]|uniref:hypothetical protein n=1 Tax=Hyphomicrobium sp. TaxID=82 RepID=UPI00356B35F3
MNEVVSNIKPAEIYSDLTAEDIAEMMAEAAAVDALFESGHISTMYLTSLTTAADVVAHAEPIVAATAA